MDLLAKEGARATALPVGARVDICMEEFRRGAARAHLQLRVPHGTELTPIRAALAAKDCLVEEEEGVEVSPGHRGVALHGGAPGRANLQLSLEEAARRMEAAKAADADEVSLTRPQVDEPEVLEAMLLHRAQQLQARPRVRRARQTKRVRLEYILDLWGNTLGLLGCKLREEANAATQAEQLQANAEEGYVGDAEEPPAAKPLPPSATPRAPGCLPLYTSATSMDTSNMELRAAQPAGMWGPIAASLCTLAYGGGWACGGGLRWAGGCCTSLKPPCSEHLLALPEGPSLHLMSLAHGMWGWGA